MIMQHALYVFIENQEYTIAEIPLFLRHPEFREHVLRNVKYATDSVDFWRHDYDEKQAEAALSRIVPFLSHPHVKHIVGQKQTTVNLHEIMEESRILLIKLSANLLADIKKFIGTILVSELLHAVRNRDKLPMSERKQFCIFVDEFQHFATEQFADLITEGRKFGVATTVAHQERFRQFGDNQKLLGATQATANKVVFQLTPKDARELASEFANPPPTEIRLERQLVVSQQPVLDMLRYGHANPRMQILINTYLRPLHRMIQQIQDQIEQYKLVRQRLQDESAAWRDLYSISTIDEKEEQYESLNRQGNRFAMYDTLNTMKKILKDAIAVHELTQQQTKELQNLLSQLQYTQEQIYRIEQFLIQIMEERIAPIPGQEALCDFIGDMLTKDYVAKHLLETREFYTLLQYGDPTLPRPIPTYMALKYMPEDMDQAFIEQQRRGGYTRGDVLVMKWTDEDFQQYWNAKASWNIFPFGLRMAFYYVDEWTEGILNKKHRDAYTIRLPSVPERFLTPEQRSTLLALSKQELQAHMLPDEDLFLAIDEVVEFCTLLQHPDNHVLVASGQYVRKERPLRTVADMTHEMEQELVALPRFTAFAKLIEEKDGEQKTLKRKIQTRKLPEPVQQKIGNITLSNMRHVDTTAFTRHREDIETEIRERQDKWRRSKPPNTPESPPPRET